MFLNTLKRQSAIIWGLKSDVCVSIQCLGIPCAFLVYYSASASHTLLLLFWMLRWLRTGLPTCQVWVALFSFLHYAHTQIFTVISDGAYCNYFSLKISCFVFPGNMLVLSAWCFSLLAGMAVCDCLGDRVVVFDLPSSSTRLPNVSKILFMIIVYPSPNCHPLILFSQRDSLLELTFSALAVWMYRTYA